jgi:regulatory protein
MGQITAIEPQTRHSNRFNIYIDDQFAIGLSDILATRLRVGQTVSDEELAQLEREESIEVARDKALRFLEPRPRSANEVKQHLAKKKISGQVIDQVIERLTEAGLLDDRAFAKYWVENREEFRPRASRALRYEMRQKGLSDAAITQALDGIDESDSAYRAGAARAPRWIGLEHRDFLQKMIPFLVRRGFDYGVAKNAADRLWKDKVRKEE